LVGRRVAERIVEDLSLHVLDLVDNCIAAGASRIRVEVREDTQSDRLSIRIADNGRGMSRREVRRALDPLFTTKAGKTVGLGLSLFAQAARESGGSMEVQSRPGRGTLVRADFGLTHIDRKPLGDLDRTMRVLRASHPEIHFEYRHTVGDEEDKHETQA
jgi:signal transduction histidine kinase